MPCAVLFLNEKAEGAGITTITKPYNKRLFLITGVLCIVVGTKRSRRREKEEEGVRSKVRHCFSVNHDAQEDQKWIVLSTLGDN